MSDIEVENPGIPHSTVKSYALVQIGWLLFKTTRMATDYMAENENNSVKIWLF